MNMTLLLKIGEIIGEAIAKYPELKVQWEEFLAEIDEAKSPDSEGGEKVTFGEIFNEIAPELLDMGRTVSPFLDNLIELFDKD